MTEPSADRPAQPSFRLLPAIGWACRRDLKLAARSRSELAVVLLFFLLVASLFPLAVSPDPALLRRRYQGSSGLILSIGLPHSYAAKLNELQRRADVPLFITADMENGPGMRLGGGYTLPHLLPLGGGTVFPPTMALGAIGSDSLAREVGRPEV